jgi:hypothetical protein
MAWNLSSLATADLCLGMSLSCGFQWKDLPIDVIISLGDLKANDKYGHNLLLAEEEGLEVAFLLVEYEIRNFNLDLRQSRLGVIH